MSALFIPKNAIIYKTVGLSAEQLATACRSLGVQVDCTIHIQ